MRTPCPRVSISVLALGLLSVLTALGPLSTPPGVAKAVRIDLRNYGWESPPPAGEYFWPSPPLAIDREGDVFVSFTTGGSPRLATRQHPGLTYHILRFSETGRLEDELSLPTNNYYGNGIYLGPTDEVIARADGKLQLLRAGDLGRAATSNWKELALCGSDCRIEQSPSRRTLFLGSFAGASTGYLARLSVLRFGPGGGATVAQSCDERDPGFFMTTGDQFMYRTEGGGKGLAPPVLVRWPLCHYEEQAESPATANGSVWPLAAGTVAIAGGVERDGKEVIAVQSVGGQVKFVLKIPKGEHVETLAPSADGTRFAASIATWRGGSQFFDISGHVSARRLVVYGVSAGQKFASIGVGPKASYPPGGHPSIDLGPEGHVVAALEDGILTIAQVP